MSYTKTPHYQSYEVWMIKETKAKLDKSYNLEKITIDLMGGSDNKAIRNSPKL